MKKGLIGLLLLNILTTSFSQVSINISYLADTVVTNSETIDDALLNENSFRDSELLVFPLKTSSVVNVVRMADFKKVYTGTISDMDGKVLKTVKLDAINNQINLKNFGFGLYVLKIDSDDKPVAEVNDINQSRAVENKDQ
ncbi:MAG TPA: hypothetical protein VK179_14860 [Bacteroidales bacterium]|nr:hypothetical protein [Bacteroidales bacterium]